MRSPVLLTVAERSRNGAGRGPTVARMRRPSPKKARLRVLVADDYEDARVMFAEYLAYSGFEVDVAADGSEAVQIALEKAPDVVVMDLAMPGVDGIEAFRQLRADPRTRKIPIVACTGQIHGREIDEARRVGFDALLLKPVALERLVQTLRSIARP